MGNLVLGAPVTGPANSGISRSSGFSTRSEPGAPKAPTAIGTAAALAEHDPPDCWTWVPIAEDEPDPGAPPFIPVPSFLVRFRADHLAQLAISDDAMAIEASQSPPVHSSKLD